MTAPSPPLSPDRSPGSHLAAVLAALELSVLGQLDSSEDFLTLLCEHASGQQRVVKYCHSGRTDALRRLRNEALLTRSLKVRRPLRVLRHCADGPGFLVTEFERGEALAPRHLGDAALMAKIADALAVWQSLEDGAHALDISERETTRHFLHKVMLKHLLHLWPTHISLAQCWRAWRLLCAGLADIEATSVLCHADLMPTNMLRDATSDDVVFIDLEGVIAAHHPLYDVLSFFTIDARPLEKWDWQRDFLHRYLAQPPAAQLLARQSAAFARAYRALLSFLLVYRYNEARINLGHGRYFEGLPKRRYVVTKLVRLLSGAGLLTASARVDGELAVRKANLHHALDDRAFGRHLAHMLTAPPAAQGHAA